MSEMMEEGAHYSLVPMDRGHLAEIAKLERICFVTPWTESMLEEELYNPAACFIVAEGEDGSVLGYAGVHVVLDEGYIDNVAVQEGCRHLGVADAMVNLFCRFGEEKLAFLTLEVRQSNLAAIHLYEKHGFSEVGRRKNYYKLPDEDAILMTRTFREEKL